MLKSHGSTFAVPTLPIDSTLTSASKNDSIDAVGAVDPAVAVELGRYASPIAARLSRFEAVAAAPTVMRIHGDLRLGDGIRVGVQTHVCEQRLDDPHG